MPAAGATLAPANQDVVVTAFVGWVDGNGAANYECVTTGGGLGGAIYSSQADAVSACSTTYATALDPCRSAQARLPDPRHPGRLTGPGLVATRHPVPAAARR